MARLGVAIAVAVMSTVLAVGPAGHVAPVAADGCDRSKLSAAQLNEVFASPNLGGAPGRPGFAGGDYQHAYPLPDGRVLWLFQDLFYSADDDLRDSNEEAGHNGGLVQDGECFTTYGAPRTNAIGPQTFLRRWYWPLDGEIGYDGALWIFFAEMVNPAGIGAGYDMAPARTWLARLDPDTLQVVSFAPAPDSGTRLYGWSVVSDDTYSYLYGHCYRQFANTPPTSSSQFDSGCMPNAWLARVPLGHFDMVPEYWTGSGWSANSTLASPSIPGLSPRGAANPVSVQWFGDVFISVSKVSDWWGTRIEIDRARRPEGPWEKVQSRSVVNDRKCQNGCGNYHAFLMPYLDSAGNMTISLSNGGEFHLWKRDASLYRPTFYSVPLPSAARTGTAAAPAAFAPVPGTAGFQPVDPVRLVDTREPGAAFGRLRPNATAVLDLRPLMPAGTQAVALNLAATGASESGFVRAYPCNGAVPQTSSINPLAGATTSNATVVPVGDGQVCLQTLRETELVIDLNGWLTTSAAVGLTPVTPVRLLDTRAGLGGYARSGPGGVIEVQAVAPGSASVAVALNVTAVSPGRDGFVTAWPCGTTRPFVANLNPQAGVTRPNFVNVRVGAGGRVCLYTLHDTDLVVDKFGEYQTGAPARYGAVSPTRLLDTRNGFSTRHPSDLSYVFPVGDIVAAQLNVTATNTSAGGFLTGFSCMNTLRPLAANVNYGAGETTGNSVLAPAGRGYSCVFPYTTSDVVVDLFGVWTTQR
jgi:hypothetical protein